MKTNELKKLLRKKYKKAKKEKNYFEMFNLAHDMLYLEFQRYEDKLSLSILKNCK